MRGCPPLFDVWAELRVACLAMQPQMLDYVQHNGISDVFLVARWAGYTDGDYDGQATAFLSGPGETSGWVAVAHGLQRTVAAYRQAGVRLWIIEQVPQQLHLEQKN